MRRSATPIANILAVLTIGLIFASAGAAAVRGENAYDPALFKALEYRLVGPFRGGRVTAVAGVRGQRDTFYMGATGGGVWKTTDAGLTWRNVSDRPPAKDGEEPPGDRFGSASVGAIAVAESDPNVVYVGMGSVDIRGNTSAGDGVYKSTDAGATWKHVGLQDAGQIGRVRVHPGDPDRVYVAALGHAFGPNPQRGVFRSRDGGKTWEKVLFVSNEAGAVDLAMDASNPRLLYAAFWEAVRQPWTMISGGPGSGLYKSTDGGDTWRELSKGLPEGIKGKIGVAVSPVRARRVWALVEHKEKGGLYRSDDGGKSFRLINPDHNLLQRPWYYTKVYADPRDENTVYIMNVAFWRSVDGGKNFNFVRTPHGDNHDLWINPDDTTVMINGNDGGANVSTNGGATWSSQTNQPTAEMYRVTVDNQFPYWLYGGQQDNSAVAIPSRTASGGIARQHWYAPAGCENAYVAIDPRNPDVTYGGCYGGSISRYDRRLGRGRQVMVYPQLAVGQAAKDLRYRFQWNAPIRISPHDPRVLYHASQFVHRSTDEGQSWQRISPDLTRNDKQKQDYAGGPISWDNTGVEVYGTVFAFEESPHQKGLMWAGSDDGRVHLSRDAGTDWQEITPKAMPEWGTVNSIELSAHASGRAFLAVHRYRQDDFSPYVFRTDDYGASWTRLTDGTNGIPANHFVRVVREDPERRGLLYAGTEFGLYVSFDDGKRWQPLQLNLPVTPITDLVVKEKDLVVATQGRSYWILDDLTPLHQLAPEVASAPVFLFRPRDAYQFGGGGGFGRQRGSRGSNPPYGVSVFYALDKELKDKEAPELTAEILGAGGKVLRSLSSKKEEYRAPSPWARFLPPEARRPRKLSAKQGLNRYVWNLRLPDAKLVDKAVLWGSAAGPEVPPGTYQVRMKMGEWSATHNFAVKADPRSSVSVEDRRSAFALAEAVWKRLGDSHEALRTIRSVRTQVKDVTERHRAAGEGEDLGDAATALAEKLTAIEEKLNQTKSRAGQDVLNFPPQIDNQLMSLLGAVKNADGRPTRGSEERFRDLDGEFSQIEQELAQVLETDLKAFQALVKEKGTPAVLVPKGESEAAGPRF